MSKLLRYVAGLVKRTATKRSRDIATNRVMGNQGLRLRQARIAAGIKSASEAARIFGMPVSSYNAHERAGSPGARMFDPDDAKRYGRRFGVSAAWLLTGEGAMSEGVPLISWVSAGALAAAGSVESLSDLELIPSPGLPKGNWIALRVVGDSMDRISPPDSIIFVNRDEKRLVANACYVFADEEGGATYKRYRPGPDRLEPVSVNDQHETYFPDHMPAVIGRVRKTMLDM